MIGDIVCAYVLEEPPKAAVGSNTFINSLQRKGPGAL